jgi:peptidoglycan/LPS O-acetylase OafA/YrhL
MSMNSATPTGVSPPARQGRSAVLLSLLFVVVAALLFTLVYISLPQNHEFTALLVIGVLALLFALGCYLAEAVSRDPTAQRSLAWAFLAMGFATLFLSVGLGPTYNVESIPNMLIGLILLVILLAVCVGLIVWRARGVQQVARQEVARTAWRSEPPVSAFSYTTANAPSGPTGAPPASPGTGTPPARGP